MNRWTSYKSFIFSLVMTIPSLSLGADIPGSTAPTAQEAAYEKVPMPSKPVRVYLQKTNGKWAASLSGDQHNPDVEQIVVDPDNGTYQLDAALHWGGDRCNAKEIRNGVVYVYVKCNSVFFSLENPDGALEAAVAESGAVKLAQEFYVLEKYRATFANAKSSKELEEFVYRYESIFDPDALVGKAKEMLQGISEKKKVERARKAAEAEAAWRAARYKDYRDDFTAAVTIAELENLIARYTKESYDPDNLLNSARAKLKAAIAQHKKELAAAAAASTARQKALADWRTQLKTGDDTFCGPVIEIKSPMVRIALRAQLSGYGNDAWLKRTELYPPSHGCQNVNGHLGPLDD